MQQWIEQAQQGDDEAFGQLMQHMRGMAYAVSYDMLKDVQLAEDVVQEASIEAYLNLKNLREPAAFPGWFKTIVVRQCHRQLRRSTHKLQPLDESVQRPTDAPGVAELAERREGERALRESVGHLSAKLRVPVELFYYYGYSLQEISAYLDLPVATLKKRLFDARRKLRGALPVADLASMFNLFYEGGRKMLHIVNGDHVGDMLKQGIVQGEVLVWREVYPAGPIFVNPAGEQERALRAEVLEHSLGIPAAEYKAACEQQESSISGFQKYDEVVLWFEHDLFDQSMLAYLLHWFKGQKHGNTRFSLLCIGEFPGIELFHGLGQLTKAQLKTLNGTWRSIGRREMELGSEFWQAYASPDPSLMAGLLEQRREELTAAGLLFMHDAFQAHLTRLPSVRNGLGRCEQTTLKILQKGSCALVELFRRVTDLLHLLGMGDLEFFRYLQVLGEGDHPLVRMEGETSSLAWRQVPDVLNRRVQLTSQGEQVLAGLADRIAVQGMDQWFGGLHLQGHSVAWRWDDCGGGLVDYSTI
ncbi:sigma-70 family RNA polymerase sigma factor [Paenibacillus donghaensis]|uniref:RNA polymerase subunit sigma n=1 Tax=Paenibacillus donghaensis TaxID=414771 RepID=A0A2Z2K8R2_9BACL|nr:sigma-70 family RNA polymerase sigma factor [Paenibacillus donghaensis]ASA23026.1 RNA polymerase subunit sigma [Paenibacillus donghaensis]